MGIIIRPPVPFTLRSLKKIYSPFEDLSCCWQGDNFYIVIDYHDSPRLIKIQENGIPDQPVLNVETSIDFDPLPFLSFLFSFQDDLIGFYNSTTSDSVMSDLIRRYYGTRIHHTRDFFESAVIAILEQQISMNVASILRKRFVERFGRGPIRYDGYTFYAFPTPEDMVKVSVDELRLVGMSYNKARAILCLANALQEGRFRPDSLSPLSPQQSIEQLIALKGIGIWTAQYILTRGLAWPNTVAHGDLGLRKAISHYYRRGEMITVEESRLFFERFSPWRHLASFYLLMDQIENGKSYRVNER
jgi:DNA-3-methyladenine glycosylase II